MTPLPLFPLPEVVLFPETFLPLHVFEPRYREMLREALAGDRLVGVQTIDPDFDAAAEGVPRLLPIGCAGEVVEHAPLEDGRSDIVLKGVFRYRVERELPGRAFRRAEVRPLPVEPLGEGDVRSVGREELRWLLARVVERLAHSMGRESAGELEPSLSDEGLVNEALSRLALPSETRYRLLAMDRLADRYSWTVGHVFGLLQRIEVLAPYRRSDFDPRTN